MKQIYSLVLIGGICLFCSSAAGAAGENTVLYATSFETFGTGRLSKEKEELVVWKSKGKAEITRKHSHTGSKSLHISGGKKSTVELTLSGEAIKTLGIRFRAKREIEEGPFEFRVLAKVDSSWEEVANLDEQVVFSERSMSEVVIKLPTDGATGLRLVCTASKKGGVLIDDFELLDYRPFKSKVYDEALFVSGTMDTHTFRIPAIITAQNGDLIAVCDARRDHGGDLHKAEDIDIVIRRSSNNGESWTEMDLVCDYGDGLPASDPSLILDESSGEIFCFYNYMDRSQEREYRLWVQSSTDHGKTWGEARDITDEITLPEWKYDFKFMTSGRGIQTRDGEMLHTLVRVGTGIHLFGSKDHGETWYLKTREPISPANESKVIELADGRLMVNCRNNGGEKARYVHISTDQGESWKGHTEMALADPHCNGSILRYTSMKDGYKKDRLLFCNANSTQGRKNLTVRISYDEGETWSEGKVIDPGGSAYSDLTICEDGTIGILYEPGYSEVRFTSITLEYLTDGKDKLSKPYQVPGVEK